MHIVDADTRPDMLEQLDMLAAPNERAVSVGPSPEGLTHQATPVHCTMGSARLAGWGMRSRIGPAEIIHAWSERALWAGRELALATGRAMVLSLPAAPIDPADWDTIGKAVGPGLLNVTVPTKFARRRLIAGGLPERFCHVLPPAARAIENADAVRDMVRQALGVPNDAKLLVAPDPFVRHAGHEYASWSHAILRHIPLELHLAIPSRGKLDEHVRFFAATTGFDAAVHFTHGRLSVAEVIAAADVAVFPQTRDVGVFCAAAAMASGRAVAASNIGSFVELSRDGELAMLMGTGPRETSAGLLKILEDDALVSRLGRAAAQAAAETLAPAIVAGKLQAIYAQALETKAI